MVSLALPEKLARPLFKPPNMKRSVHSLPIRDLRLSRWMPRLAGPVLTLAIALTPSAAWAQPGPQRGGLSWWAEAGFVKPAAANATAGGSAGIDYFLSQSLSVGFAGGFWRASSTDGTAKEAYLDAVVTRSFDFRRIRPLVQGGLGLYHSGFPSASASRLGGFAGLGVDVFFTRSAAIEVLARYHLTPDVGGRHAGFFESLGGVKMDF
jgi:hypothetical protein